VVGFGLELELVTLHLARFRSPAGLPGSVCGPRQHALCREPSVCSDYQPGFSFTGGIHGWSADRSVPPLYIGNGNAVGFGRRIHLFDRGSRTEDLSFEGGSRLNRTLIVFAQNRFGASSAGKPRS
jgi:hypothetical protein